MAYSERLAERMRRILAERSETMKTTEKKMFGGLAFMVDGNMCCGVLGDELMARVGPETYEDALRLPHAREMDFTGRPLTGYVYVSAEGVASASGLADWVSRALAFVDTLPAK
ncbi:MAG: TfoX/Sxy family protein [Rhodothermales bacterium]